jgi:hypothetical protein
MAESSLLVSEMHVRSAIRYKLHLPVIFRWFDGTSHTEGGFTYDVSVNAALILSKTCPPVGTELRIEFLIPCPDNQNEEIRIAGTGKVLRVTERPASFGVRIVFDDDQITRHVLM